MTCPIPTCTFEASPLGFCRGHFDLVPKPIRSEIYEICKRHRGGPSHQKAIRRACIAVQSILDQWERERRGVPAEQPDALPYKDD